MSILKNFDDCYYPEVHIERYDDGNTFVPVIVGLFDPADPNDTHSTIDAGTVAVVVGEEEMIVSIADIREALDLIEAYRPDPENWKDAAVVEAYDKTDPESNGRSRLWARCNDLWVAITGEKDGGITIRTDSDLDVVRIVPEGRD